MRNTTRSSIGWLFFFCAFAAAAAFAGSAVPIKISSTRPTQSSFPDVSNCLFQNSVISADCATYPAHATKYREQYSAVTPADASSWPGRSNTGVPDGINLVPYTGPCKITRPKTIIDSKIVSCDLLIRTSGVVITRSKINGYISSDSDKSTGYSFTLEDSEVNASPNGPRAVTAVGEVNFVVRRSRIYGGNRTANCWQSCLIEDSWLHGQDTDKSGAWHESAVRMGEDAVIRHNTLVCDALDVPPDAGCSASLTGYGDFGPVQNNIIEGNWFPGTTGGFCAYGGSSKGKPHSNAAKNIVFKDNVFGRGSSGKCGVWGPITDFDSTRPGNQWINNRWENGVKIPTP